MIYFLKTFFFALFKVKILCISFVEKQVLLSFQSNDFVKKIEIYEYYYLGQHSGVITRVQHSKSDF